MCSTTIKSKVSEFHIFLCATAEFHAFYMWNTWILFLSKKLMKSYNDIQLKIAQTWASSPNTTSLKHFMCKKLVSYFSMKSWWNFTTMFNWKSHKLRQVESPMNNYWKLAENELSCDILEFYMSTLLPAHHHPCRHCLCVTTAAAVITTCASTLLRKVPTIAQIHGCYPERPAVWNKVSTCFKQKKKKDLWLGPTSGLQGQKRWPPPWLTQRLPMCLIHS